jgi:hypothetical protein
MGELIHAASADIEIMYVLPFHDECFGETTLKSLRSTNPGVKIYANTAEIDDVGLALELIYCIGNAIREGFAPYLEVTLAVAKHWITNPYQIDPLMTTSWDILTSCLKIHPQAEVMNCVIECVFGMAMFHPFFFQAAKLSQKAIEQLIDSDAFTPELIENVLDWIHKISGAILDEKAKKAGQLIAIDSFDDDATVVAEMDEALELIAESVGVLTQVFPEIAVPIFGENLLPRVEGFASNPAMIGAVNPFIAEFTMATHNRDRAIEFVKESLSVVDDSRRGSSEATILRLGRLFETFPLDNDEAELAREIAEFFAEWIGAEQPDDVDGGLINSIQDAAVISFTKFLRVNLAVFNEEEVLAEWMGLVGFFCGAPRDSDIVFQFLAEVLEAGKEDSLGGTWVGATLDLIMRAYQAGQARPETVERIRQLLISYMEEMQAEPLFTNLLAAKLDSEADRLRRFLEGDPALEFRYSSGD